MRAYPTRDLPESSELSGRLLCIGTGEERKDHENSDQR